MKWHPVRVVYLVGYVVIFHCQSDGAVQHQTGFVLFIFNSPFSFRRQLRLIFVAFRLWTSTRGYRLYSRIGKQRRSNRNGTKLVYLMTGFESATNQRFFRNGKTKEIC